MVPDLPKTLSALIGSSKGAHLRHKHGRSEHSRVSVCAARHARENRAGGDVRNQPAGRHHDNLGTEAQGVEASDADVRSA